VSSSGSSFVGDQTYTGRGVQPGHQTNNFTESYPPVYPPFSSTTPRVQTPTNGTIAGVDYTYVLRGGNYFATNLDSAAYGKSIYIERDSTLFVTGNIDLSTIVFANDGVTRPHLYLFVSAPSVTFAPSIVGGTAPQFWVFGLPSCTTMTLVSRTTFVGIIYAPNVDLRAEGGAALCGAIVAATFECFGGFDFHYDSATRGIEAKEFKILSWAEL
jgi:Putative Ice-binding-like adhesive domain